MDPKHPGWHTTDTIDLLYVVSGACVLKLDSGETTPLKAGEHVDPDRLTPCLGKPKRPGLHIAGGVDRCETRRLRPSRGLFDCPELSPLLRVE
jgi:hypothetical protein